MPLVPKQILLTAVILLATLLHSQATGRSMHLSSTAFSEGQTIPTKFTCSGPDVSPPLSWSGAPSTTKTFALIMDDPDAPAGTWVHWVVYNIPANVTEFTENAPYLWRQWRDKAEQHVMPPLEGRNSFGKIGYGGPCPPPGKPHRYFFKLYALDTKLDLKPVPTKSDLERAMQNHIAAQTQLIGRFSR
jgi:Raf kinase inhibitor-like YbhB/YbcL family protein